MQVNPQPRASQGLTIQHYVFGKDPINHPAKDFFRKVVDEGSLKSKTLSKASQKEDNKLNVPHSNWKGKKQTHVWTGWS